MPNLSNVSREKILKALEQQPGFSHFTGWDQYGTQKLNTGEGRRSFDTAMRNPAYDESIERALVRDSAGLDPSPLQQRTPYALDLPTERLRYTQEVRPSASGAVPTLQSALIRALRNFGINTVNR